MLLQKTLTDLPHVQQPTTESDVGDRYWSLIIGIGPEMPWEWKLICETDINLQEKLKIWNNQKYNVFKNNFN